MQEKDPFPPYIKRFQSSNKGLSPISRTKDRRCEQTEFTEEFNLTRSRRINNPSQCGFYAKLTVRDERNERTCCLSSMAAGDGKRCTPSQKQSDNR